MKINVRHSCLFALCCVIALSLLCFIASFADRSQGKPADVEYLQQRVRGALYDLGVKEDIACVIIQTHVVGQYVLIEATCWESEREYAFKADGEDIKASAERFAQFPRDRFTIGELMDDIDAPFGKAWLLVAKRKIHDADFEPLT